MQFTALLGEMLIIGATALYVALKLVSEVNGLAYLDPSAIGSRLDLAVLGALLSYPFGVMWSRLSDVMFSHADGKLVANAFGDRESYHRRLAEVLKSDTPLASGLAEFRSNFRVCRAITCTLLLGALSAAIGFGVGREVRDHLGARVLLTLGQILLAIGAYATWGHLRASYLAFVKHATEAEASPRN